MKRIVIAILLITPVVVCAQVAPQAPPPGRPIARAGVPASWEALLSRVEQRTDLTLPQKQALMHSLEDARSEYQDAAKKFSVDHAADIKRAHELKSARDARGETAVFTDAETAELKKINAGVSADAKALDAARTKFYGTVVKTLPADMLIDLLKAVLVI